jgi:hypothetical protein
VVEVVPADIVAPEDRKHVLHVFVTPRKVGPFTRLRWRSNELDDLDTAVGPRPLDAG